MSQQSNLEWKQLESDTARIVHGLFRVRNFIWEQDHRIVGEYGLTWGQFTTLVELRKAIPLNRLSPTELYDAVQVTSGGLTKILNGLEQKSLVERVDNPEDGRSLLVQITDNGRTLIEEVVDHLVDINRALLGKSLSNQQIESLAGLLDIALSELEV
ncbi:MAG: MarR family transcriptional regulator [Gammaproteobacteria bacterium]|nr:MarR family transcriptional regulator [Candidatus Brocadiales bacterium]MBL7003131.1 MarR family transcriptional regulator [Gammaproteobacteria bacterium]